MTKTGDEVLNNNLFFLSSALARKLSAQSDEVFAQFGLSTSHVLILMLVKDEPGIRPGTLADKLYLKPSTITRLVQKLEGRQLVERNSEGRATSIVCTSKGSNMTPEIISEWQRLWAQKREKLGDRYVEVLSEMISNALLAFGED